MFRMTESYLGLAKPKPPSAYLHEGSLSEASIGILDDFDRLDLLVDDLEGLQERRWIVTNLNFYVFTVTFF